jgi:type IV pilus assembly protein PilM
MQRVIGLDIGSYSIKAVEILNTLKSYEIVNFYENVVPHLDGVPMDAVAPSCMEQLFKENNLTADRIVTAMPGQFISSRIMSFGFSDARKIATAVFSEIETAVPFDMEEMVWDHQVLGTVGNQSVALAVMTRKAFLRNFLELLQRINIDPKIVDIDSLAFYNLSSYMQGEPGESFGMIDVGHEKTSVCIVRDGVLRMFRSINLGGRFITEFLARDLEISFQEAQRIKHQVSRIMCADDQATDLKGDERMVVERMTLATNSIIKELGRTFYAFKTWEKDPISKVYLSGGTSRIKYLTNFIEDQLEVKALPCRLDSTDLKMKPELSEYMTVIPQSVAIGIRTVASVRKHSQVNLRTGEFAYVQNYESLLRIAFRGAKLAAIAVALLLFSYGVKYVFYQQHISKLQEQYKKELAAISLPNQKKFEQKQTFARFSKDVEKSLSSQIGNMRSGIEVFKAENSSMGPLFLLKELSDAIPKEIKVDVTLFDFKVDDTGVAKLVFRAETEGYANQAAVIDAIKKVPSLGNIVEKGAQPKLGSNNKVIEFTVNAEYLSGGGAG